MAVGEGEERSEEVRKGQGKEPFFDGAGTEPIFSFCLSDCR